MREKLTIKFFNVILGIIMITILSTIMINIGVINFDKYFSEEFYNSSFNMRSYSKTIKKYITYEENGFQIPYKLAKILQENSVWVQVLNEDNTEVYTVNPPPNLPKVYKTYELLSYTAQSGALCNSTLYTDKLVSGGKHYTVIVGYSTEEYKLMSIGISKAVRMRYMWTMIFSLMGIGVGGYYFSHMVTKPVAKIIEDIKFLASGNYMEKITNIDPFYNEVNEAIMKLSTSLAQNEVRTKELEEKRGEWIANISHDLKAPLSTIKGYSQLLNITEYELMPEEIHKYGSIIEKNAVYMEELITDLSFIYKIKNKGVLMDIKTQNVIPIIQDVVISILNNPKYEKKAIAFEYLQEKVFLECDKTLLTRAVMNLVYNAVVHNPEETKIQLKVIKKRSTIKIILVDDGIGISKEDIDALFNRYYRASNTGKSQGGSGLGMAISKEIIEGQGGLIDLESTPGKGTTIIITFKNKS